MNLILSKRAKEKDDINKELIGRPEVEIHPGIKSNIYRAVERLKEMKGANYFGNVSKIVDTAGAMYGSEKGSLISINPSKIKKLLTEKLRGATPSHEDYQELFTLVAMIVLAHEIGHANRPDDGETPAVIEEKDISDRVEMEIQQIINKYNT